jgi:glutaredoxin
MSNFTLFVKTGCPYSDKVLAFAERNAITFTTVKNRDAVGVRAEVIARGGKSQFPYFIDEKARIEMYESEDIIAYLGGSSDNIPKKPLVCRAF